MLAAETLYERDISPHLVILSIEREFDKFVDGGLMV